VFINYISYNCINRISKYINEILFVDNNKIIIILVINSDRIVFYLIEYKYVSYYE